MVKEEKAIFAAGCFWGVQDDFDAVPGVLKTKVGYTGGKTKDPTYEQICEGGTGHAEAVCVVYNPEKVSFKELVETFLEIHDPTQLNQQGPDIGTQYRSAIFYLSDEQKRIAHTVIQDNKKKMKNKIVTLIVKAGVFYDAEEYHQNYNKKNGRVCRI